jgi:hypothetical protein
MSEFLEKLKADFMEAQKRQQEIGGRLQALQVEFQAVSQEVNSYAKIVEVQTKKEQGVVVAAPATRAPSLRINGIQITQIPSSTIESAEETNKTELVRELLRQHPAGMTGGELWKAVQNKFPHRQYVYSVLARLKRKGDVSQKRKKFFFTAKPEEVSQSTVQ